MKAFLFGLGGILALAIIQFWPRPDGIWLVQMHPRIPPAAAASQLLSMPVRLLDTTDSRTFIVKASSSLSAADLYSVGALVVVQANVAFGCNPPENAPAWAKTE